MLFVMESWRAFHSRYAKRSTVFAMRLSRGLATVRMKDSTPGRSGTLGLRPTITYWRHLYAESMECSRLSWACPRLFRFYTFRRDKLCSGRLRNIESSRRENRLSNALRHVWEWVIWLANWKSDSSRDWVRDFAKAKNYVRCRRRPTSSWRHLPMPPRGCSNRPHPTSRKSWKKFVTHRLFP